MSYYLIGIGGTGARCLESFVNLNGAGLLKDNQEVNVLFVDADKSCGNLLKTQYTAELYNKVQNLKFGENDLFKNRIVPFKAWSPVPEKSNNLDDVFERIIMSNKDEYKALSYLYDSLFTEQERTTDLAMGFRGHPAIGAAVMSQSMDADVDEVWKDVIQKINTDKDARIFLFASAFGGTGAAGFPTIARILHNSLKKDDNGESLANIGGALILPYFRFKTPSAKDDVSKEMQAKADEFMINTKAALSYYIDSDLLDNIFKKIYLLGDSDFSEVGDFSLGSQSQKNTAHIIEIFAALAAFDFFNQEKFSKFETPMCAREDGSNKITWEDLPDNNNGFRTKLKAYIKFMCIYNNYIHEMLEKDRLKPIPTGLFSSMRSSGRQSWEIDLLEKAGNVDIAKNEIWQDFITMKDYTERFLEWLEEIESNAERQVELVKKDIFNTNANKVGFDYNDMLNDRNINVLLTEKEIVRGLAGYASRHKKDETNSGIGILLNAVYEICK